MPFSISNELSGCDDHDVERIRKRMTLLSSHCERYGISEIRDDSRLAFAWSKRTEMEDDLTGMHRVLSLHRTLQWIHDETDYSSSVQKDMRMVANEVHRFAPLVSWSEVWDITKKHAPFLLQLKSVLRQSPDGVPKAIFIK